MPHNVFFGLFSFPYSMRSLSNCFASIFSSWMLGTLHWSNEMVKNAYQINNECFIECKFNLNMHTENFMNYKYVAR